MKIINRNGLIMSCILTAYAVYILYLLLSGNLKYFIHPRMFKYLWISELVIIFLVIIQMLNLKRAGSRERIEKKYVLLAVPIVMGIMVHPGKLTLAAAENKGTASAGNYSSRKIDSKDIDFIEDNTVIFNDDEYCSILNDLAVKPLKYKGMGIEITGFVYRNKYLPGDEFLLSRFLMICCAADTQIVGIPVKLKASEKFRDGDWYKLDGTIGYEKYKAYNGVFPVIDIKNAEKIQPDNQDYIYP